VGRLLIWDVVAIGRQSLDEAHLEMTKTSQSREAGEAEAVRVPVVPNFIHLDDASRQCHGALGDVNTAIQLYPYIAFQHDALPVTDRCSNAAISWSP
jgi:hypothetical protein